MVSLRHFIAEDIPVLQSIYQTMTEDEIRKMLADWYTMKHDSRYFEMFAVCDGNEIVGEISLYHHSKSSISIGPTIYESFRRQGYGKQAMSLAILRARELGYRILIQQVRCDNEASIALHNSLGFELDGNGYVYKDRKGHPCYLFLMAL